MEPVTVFILLVIFPIVYWIVALVAPRRRDGVPGINLPEVSATPETWKAAHSAIAPRMIVLSVYATVAAIAIPGAMRAGVDVPNWVFLTAIAVGVIWFSAQIPRALKTAREVSSGVV